jgi:CheY-like chemotaxis protein
MSRDRATPLAGCRVLLVEDEMLVAMSIEDALAEAGCEVVGPVGTVDGALALLEDSRLDAAVLDMNLNGRSGIPVADALVQNAVPFLVLSGYGAAAVSGSHRHVPVLSKPFVPEQLIDALKRLVEPPAGHDGLSDDGRRQTDRLTS